MRQGAIDRRDVGSGPPPLGISAISELAAGRDEQIGKIFRNMRAALKLSRDVLARRLATNASVIDSFEAGALTSLPHWKETERIVRSYCDLLRFDPEPILWRLRSQLQAVSNYSRPAPHPEMSPQAPRQPSAEGNPDRAGGRPPLRRRRRRRLLVALSTPVVFAAALVLAGQSFSRPVYEAIALLPAPIAHPVRAGFDYFAGSVSQNREGLTWIEVSDPRTRKADKLPARAQ